MFFFLMELILKCIHEEELVIWCDQATEFILFCLVMHLLLDTEGHKSYHWKRASIKCSLHVWWHLPYHASRVHHWSYSYCCHFPKNVPSTLSTISQHSTAHTIIYSFSLQYHSKAMSSGFSDFFLQLSRHQHKNLQHLSERFQQIKQTIDTRFC